MKLVPIKTTADRLVYINPKHVALVAIMPDDDDHPEGYRPERTVITMIDGDVRIETFNPIDSIVGQINRGLLSYD